MKIDIDVRHYAPQRGDFSNPDKSKIWVTVSNPANPDEWDDYEYLGGGYISNLFPEGYFDAEDGTFKKQKLTGVVTKTVVMEHSNGGRDNNKEYSSVQEYLADPIVKEACRHVTVGGLSARISRCGDPNQVDFVRTFKIDGYSEEFTIKDSGYSNIMPQEWMNEFHANTIEGLSKCKVWDTAQQALNNTKSTDDLFGERYFPVLKAPVELTSKMQSICDGFKSQSTPLTDSEFVYIGIRSKSYEIGTINEIYEAGGWILCYQEWNWG